MRNTRIITVGVAAALLLAAHAAAADDANNAPTYTGCLKGGKLESVSVGDAPLTPCGAGESQVRLSGGDVTSVAAGPGLRGGGTAGAVTLGVDSYAVQSRVAGSCDRGDASIRAVYADGSVSCNPDDAGPGTDVFAGFHDDPLSLPVNATHAPEALARLPIAPGKYLVAATLDLESVSIAAVDVACELRAGTDFDRTTRSFASVLNQSGQHSERIALQVAHEFTDPSQIVIACAATGAARLAFLKVAATRVSRLTNAPLELVSP